MRFKKIFNVNLIEYYPEEKTMLELLNPFNDEALTEIHEESKPSLNPDQKEKPKKSYLTAEHKLILHTELAKVVFNGTWNQGRIGLIQFASVMRLMWRAAREDDPYAEWFLLKIYDAIEKAKKQIKHYESLLQQQMSQMRGFKIDLFKNPEPIQQSLRFATPFAFMGAMLLEHFDYVNRQLYTLQRVGLLAKNNLVPAHLLKEVQKVFVLSMGWKYTGVTRQDMLENNPKAKKAIELFGELPAGVLNKEIKFAFLPRKRTPQAEKGT
jgi:integrating conjugative element protein (TIGR03761 family)